MPSAPSISELYIGDLSCCIACRTLLCLTANWQHCFRVWSIHDDAAGAHMCSTVRTAGLHFLMISYDQTVLILQVPVAVKHRSCLNICLEQQRLSCCRAHVHAMMQQQLQPAPLYNTPSLYNTLSGAKHSTRKAQALLHITICFMGYARRHIAYHCCRFCQAALSSRSWWGRP